MQIVALDGYTLNPGDNPWDEIRALGELIVHDRTPVDQTVARAKDADVIVTNPDHVAVALKYDKDADVAPKVLAKGLDFKAERIKALARDSDVPTLRNVPLAHALLRVEVGEQIPEELYDAVAEVLNLIYELQKEQQAGGKR